MKRFFLFFIIITTSIALQSQITSGSKELLLKESRRLYNDKEYTTALTVLSRLDYSKLNNLEQQETDFLRATSTFKINPLEGRALMLRYIEKYPESIDNPIITVYIAESYYYGKNFEQACTKFAQCNFERIPEEERESAELYYALSLQECGRNEEAVALLNKLKLTGKRHRSDAIFHLATTDYHNNKLQQAYEGFKSIEMDDKFHLEVPYYLAGIYLKNKEYIRAEKVATLFLQHNADKKQGVPMRQMLGGAYFGQKRYEEAIPQLEQYIEETAEPQPISLYQLGISLFETSNYPKAAKMFERCINSDDIIAQSSYLHLGIIQLKLNDINKARLAFEQAANMEYDNQIRQEALYNYALCIHQTRYSPFAESVKVFERFLNEYPDSPRSSQVSKYLVEVYMNTQNYDVALQSIEKIKNPSDEILEAKQKILYRLGVQSIIDNDLNSAINYMNRSIALSRYNSDTHSDALYWRGESYYRIKNYETAANDYRAVLSLSPRNSEEALYGLAYTYFQLGKYNEAESTFNRFLKQSGNNKDTSMKADAYNRIGDCYFYNRNYTMAQQFYNKAADIDKQNSDYALYRAAVTQGLQKDYSKKTETLQKLLSQHPESNYAEQAYYEIGRSYIAQERNNEAVRAFNKLIDKYPDSPLARRAKAETAMIYNQDGNTEKAILTYKQIINEYPQSEEALIAAQDLKNIYVELGKIDEYAKYAASTPNIKTIESSERDTLTYISAEKTYSRRDYKEALKAFEHYLKEFPDGTFTLDSHYYMGIIHNNDKSYTEALKHFNEVISFPDNKYSEDAMAIASEIYHNKEQYKEAYELYKKLITVTNNEERKQACRMNMMRCAYLLKDYNNAITAAEALLSSNNLSPEWERETYYTHAKSLLSVNREQETLKYLTKLSEDTRSIQGAEGKYLLAQYYYNDKKYEKCEKEILHYIDISTPHAYWLARSFILLSDLYITQGRDVEARQYLLSLQNNYSGDDDIATLIEERLSKLAVKTSENNN